MDTTFQGSLMSPRHAPVKKTKWELWYEMLRTQGISSLLLLILIGMVPMVLYMARDEVRAWRADSAAEKKDIAEINERIAIKHQEVVRQVVEGNRENTQLIVDALTRTDRKVEENTKTLKGAAETVKDAAGKIEAATGNVQ